MWLSRFQWFLTCFSCSACNFRTQVGFHKVILLSNMHYSILGYINRSLFCWGQGAASKTSMQLLRKTWTVGNIMNNFSCKVHLMKMFSFDISLLTLEFWATILLYMSFVSRKQRMRSYSQCHLAVQCWTAKVRSSFHWPNIDEAKELDGIGIKVWGFSIWINPLALLCKAERVWFLPCQN